MFEYDPDRFARADGFACAAEQANWFHARYGLEWQGEAIAWQLVCRHCGLNLRLGHCPMCEPEEELFQCR